MLRSVTPDFLARVSRENSAFGWDRSELGDLSFIDKLIEPQVSSHCQVLSSFGRDDAYAYFNVIRDGRNDHGKGATQLGRCAAVFLELSLWDS